jgi:hypothetical protein
MIKNDNLERIRKQNVKVYSGESHNILGDINEQLWK